MVWRDVFALVDIVGRYMWRYLKRGRCDILGKSIRGVLLNGFDIIFALEPLERQLCGVEKRWWNDGVRGGLDLSGDYQEDLSGTHLIKG